MRQCIIAAFVFFEIVRVPHVGVKVFVAACCWTNCVHVCVVPVCVVICVRRHIAASSLARYVGTVHSWVTNCDADVYLRHLFLKLFYRLHWLFREPLHCGGKFWVHRFLSGCVRKAGETDRETHRFEIVTAWWMTAFALVSRCVMDCMCSYQVIRAWLLEQAR